MVETTNGVHGEFTSPRTTRAAGVLQPRARYRGFMLGFSIDLSELTFDWCCRSLLFVFRRFPVMLPVSFSHVWGSGAGGVLRLSPPSGTSRQQSSPPRCGQHMKKSLPPQKKASNVFFFSKCGPVTVFYKQCDSRWCHLHKWSRRKSEIRIWSVSLCLQRSPGKTALTVLVFMGWMNI